MTEAKLTNEEKKKIREIIGLRQDWIDEQLNEYLSEILQMRSIKLQCGLTLAYARKVFFAE